MAYNELLDDSGEDVSKAESQPKKLRNFQNLHSEWTETDELGNKTLHRQVESLDDLPSMDEMREKAKEAHEALNDSRVLKFESIKPKVPIRERLANLAEFCTEEEQEQIREWIEDKTLTDAELEENLDAEQMKHFEDKASELRRDKDK